MRAIIQIRTGERKMRTILPKLRRIDRQAISQMMESNMSSTSNPDIRLVQQDIKFAILLMNLSILQRGAKPKYE